MAVLLCSFVVLGIGSRVSYAGEIDILLDKLVAKGILTPGEAQEIGTETKEQVKKEIAEGKYSSLPTWVQNTKLKGDFRVRYQYDHGKTVYNATRATDIANDQQRARIRVRLGLESKVNDKVLVGIGIATGKSDGSADAARSTNATLGEGGFGKKLIALDYGYAQYSPFSWATLIGGKFKNPLWEPGDLIWDTDINPEGGAVKLSKKFGPKTEMFLNTGVLTVENNKTFAADATMFAVQPGITYNLTDTISLKGAVSYYGFSGVKGKVLSGTAGTNTVRTNGGLKYEYNNVVPAMELAIKEPFKALKLDIPYLALFGEFVNNTASNLPKNGSGYMLGFKLGAEKVEKWGDWQLRYNYAMLEKDAVLDILPDSDRYGGKTGIKAHEAIFDYGLGKNTWLGLDYYLGWQLPGNFAQKQTKPASVMQVDWNMKF